MTIFELNILGFHIAPSYYWLMYAFAFIYGIWFIKSLSKYSDSQRETLFLYVFFWVILWGRLGYVIFYNFSYYLSSPWEVLKFWEWGMSFHGGMLWVILAAYLFSKKYQFHKWDIWDDLAFIAPVWIFFWRIGNYLNKELLWFPYNGPLAVETNSGSYFPSPLVEAFFEGIILFFILRYFYYKKKFHGQVLALFLILYWVFRFFIEIFIRTPDSHIGYYFWFLTQGSLLSLPMIIVGWFLYFYQLKRA